MSNAAASLPSTSRLPILELPTLSAQRSLELNGSSSDDAAPPGHTAALVCAVALAAVKHILWAKGQIADPVAVMERQRKAEQLAANGKRATVKGARQRKRDKLLSAMEALATSLSAALEVLASFPATSSTSRSFPLLLLHGPSLLLPRALSLIHLQAAVPCAASHPNSAQQYDEVQRLAQEKRRRKQEGALERRLVRFLVEAGNDAEGEEALGLNKPLAPTKTHVMLLAPASFSCPGWAPRRNLRLDMSGFVKAGIEEEEEEEEAQLPTEDMGEGWPEASSSLPTSTPHRNASSSSLIDSYNDDVPPSPSHSRSSSARRSHTSTTHDAPTIPFDTPLSSRSTTSSSAGTAPFTTPAPFRRPLFPSLPHASRTGSTCSSSTDEAEGSADLHALVEALSPLKRYATPATHGGGVLRPGFPRKTSGNTPGELIPGPSPALPFRTPRTANIFTTPSTRRAFQTPARTRTRTSALNEQSSLETTSSSSPLAAPPSSLVSSSEAEAEAEGEGEEEEDLAAPALALEQEQEQRSIPPPGARMFAKQHQQQQGGKQSLLARYRMSSASASASSAAAAAGESGQKGRARMTRGKKCVPAGGFVVDCALSEPGEKSGEARDNADEKEEEVMWFVCSVTL